MHKQTEDIKVRVDRPSKLALAQMATEEDLALSDIVRRAIKQFIRRELQQPENGPACPTPKLRTSRYAFQSP